MHPFGITLQFDDVPLVDLNDGFGGVLIQCEAEIEYSSPSEWAVSSVTINDAWNHKTARGGASVDLFSVNPALYAIVANAIERTQGEYISREIAAVDREAA